MKEHSEKFLRHRKLLSVAPLLIAPFLTMLFWALGGGKGVSGAPSSDAKGLNTQIPNAQLDENAAAWDKFALYEQAKRDSLRKAEAERTDPYFRLRTITEVNKKDSLGLINASLGKKDFQEITDEIEISRKISEINAAINSPVKTKVRETPVATKAAEEEQTDESIDRLEQMMLMMQSEGQADPEMLGVESVLEKILDVQHPERVRQRIEQQSIKHQGKVFPVSKMLDENVVKGFGEQTSDSGATKASFINAGDAQPTTKDANLIKAVIHKDQILTSGSVVRLRLSDEVYINGNKVSEGTFLFGICSMQNERLLLNIQSILFHQTLVPVSLAVYDFDGLEGIYIPGSTANEATRQGSEQLLQGVQLMSLDPSIGAQAASAGIETAKTLFSRKNRMIRVQVKSGYQVFLKDTSKNTKTF